ncbi:serine hydrolase domain-containing protein [Streptomyces sp. NBC_00670]|jgi:CubicO group peptidase (beta-lactamase class C family)|uniref:serine hydrolase domain-containing protein n=1 Tax=Streptomyces sp. NBC_00670 TaxID=2975804 RepID=UPI002E356444|nr:serine hydrolase domain-containing protein [Streptomyces sp. NBC_00670]
MATLEDVLTEHVGKGWAPGAVALVARGEEVEAAAVGTRALGGSEAMTRDTLFRIASLTKPLTAAAVMVLVDDGRLSLDDPVATWLPELAHPRVVRTPRSELDDTVPAARPITVFHLLASQAGYGLAPDFSLPHVRGLFGLQGGSWEPAGFPSADTWMARLGDYPLLHHPGDAWLYNTCSDVQGVLVARVTGRPLPEFLAERLLAPLGMADTGFSVPPGRRDRFATYYQPTPDGGLTAADGPDGMWSEEPAFASGAGGLVSTVDDYLAFARMLLADGETPDGRRVLSASSVRLMRTDHTSADRRAASELFLQGQGWGFGGSVDIAERDPWNSPGRYGWVGGTGTTAHLDPATGTVALLMTQRAMGGPVPEEIMRDFWRYAARA